MLHPRGEILPARSSKQGALGPWNVKVTSSSCGWAGEPEREQEPLHRAAWGQLPALPASPLLLPRSLCPVSCCFGPHLSSKWNSEAPVLRVSCCCRTAPGGKRRAPQRGAGGHVEREEGSTSPVWGLAAAPGCSDRAGVLPSAPGPPLGSPSSPSSEPPACGRVLTTPGQGPCSPPVFQTQCPGGAWGWVVSGSELLPGLFLEPPLQPGPSPGGADGPDRADLG